MRASGVPPRPARERAGRPGVDRVGRRAARRSGVRAPLLRRLGSWRRHPGGAPASASTPTGRCRCWSSWGSRAAGPGAGPSRRPCTSPARVVVLGRPASRGRGRLRGDHLSRSFAGVPGARPRVPGPPPRAHDDDDRRRDLRRCRAYRLLTAGGSAFFDLVVDRLRGPWPGDADVGVVLRSGCYLTHDSGIYERVSPLADTRRRTWVPAGDGAVGARCCPGPSRSSPSSGSASATCRSTSICPIAADRAHAAPAMSVRAERTARRSVELNDQHAYARGRAGPDARAWATWCGCGLSHPCTAFDKWRVIPVLDDEDRVIDAIATFF